MSVWDRLAALYARETHAPEMTAGNIEHAGGMGAKTTYKTRWYGLGGEESSSTAITRRYYLSGRPCPQDGIIKPTASLEKK